MAKTQPFSIRLSSDAGLVVEEEMRRTGRSRSAVVEELAEEAAKMRLFPGIAFRGPEPRRPWVVGTGLDVWEIVGLHRDYDGDVDRLLRTHELLSERAVLVALAYAERYTEEIEQALAENRRPLEEWRALYPFIGVAGRRESG
jgi:uncharacterized protein (DUF433 family)